MLIDFSNVNPEQFNKVLKESIEQYSVYKGRKYIKYNPINGKFKCTKKEEKGLRLEEINAFVIVVISNPEIDEKIKKELNVNFSKFEENNNLKQYSKSNKNNNNNNNNNFFERVKANVSLVTIHFTNKKKIK